MATFLGDMIGSPSAGVPYPFLDQKIIETYSAFTTCDVSDALCKLGDPYGGFIPGPSMFSPERQAGDTKIVGQAYTVEYARLDDPREKIAGHYIDQIPPGSIIFISSPDRTPNAVYGGLMSARAKASGAVGTVVNGRIRDLAEHRSMGYPVFASDIGTTSPNAILKVVAIHQPLHFASPTSSVNPGDLIIADLNGVVVVPLKRVDEVLGLMKPQVAADEKVREAIDAGMSFQDAVKKYR